MTQNAHTHVHKNTTHTQQTTITYCMYNKVLRSKKRRNDFKRVVEETRWTHRARLQEKKIPISSGHPNTNCNA